MGIAFGMVFQIVDDILDVTDTTEQLGKPAGHDLVEGVYTLPVLRTLAMDGGVGEELGSLLGKPLDVARAGQGVGDRAGQRGVESAATTARRYVARRRSRLRRTSPPGRPPTRRRPCSITPALLSVTFSPWAASRSVSELGGLRSDLRGFRRPERKKGPPRDPLGGPLRDCCARLSSGDGELLDHPQHEVRCAFLAGRCGALDGRRALDGRSALTGGSRRPCGIRDMSA